MYSCAEFLLGVSTSNSSVNNEDRRRPQSDPPSWPETQLRSIWWLLPSTSTIGVADGGVERTRVLSVDEGPEA
ncbi:hypothetical protein KGA66_26555 [Actinocrinis puniceicyclus]|uniref:Uncharacterized protein n=1 Tax=Actinocrinis puniceicyclus TaxID=977794 RepID=A0A8J7WQF2_9ACTN|nr:hypothetical protein [Actinocrinis puniceicyclus]MBS2966626.1 hypothetical protein [Actinocrinis puniceicyclus]